VPHVLASVTHSEGSCIFTPTAFDVLYLPQDLYDSTEAVRTVKEQLVDLEQVGFSEVPVRTAITHQGEETGIGPYEFTVRFHMNAFEDGRLGLLADEPSGGE